MITGQQESKVKPLKFFTTVNNIYTPKHIQSEIMIFWRITESCNLSCDYCHWFENKPPQETEENLKKIVDVLFEYFNKNNIKSVLFYYHGGEPTRIKFIDNIMQYITDCGLNNNIKISHEMQTNLLCKTETLQNLLSKIDLINVTPHFAHYNNANKLLFETNMQYLMNNNVPIHNFDVMLETLSEEKFEEFKKWIETYLNYDKIMNCEMIYNYWRVDNNEPLRQKYLDFYHKHNKTYQQYSVDGTIYDTNELFGNGLDCRGWRCEAGQKSIMLLGNGNVFVCGRPMTDWLNKLPGAKAYTNLLTDKFAINKLSVLRKFGTICDSNECGGEYYLKKWKEQKE